MTLDEQLRATLRARADLLTPAADPFTGVEQRARGLRRRRAALAVTGTALAVLGVVGAVPLLTPSGSSAPGVVATAAPSADAAPDAANLYALDARDPWRYRGDPVVREQLGMWQREWAVRHPGLELLPLFGQVWEPSGQPELVFASRQPGADSWWLGLAQTGAAGPVFRTTESSGPVNAVALVVPGDEADRLLLVASPRTERLQYAPDGSTFEDLTPLAPGVATTAVEQTPDTADQYQVIGQDGLLLQQGAVDDEPLSDSGITYSAPAPENVLDWPVRGAVEPDMLLAARRAYATSRRVEEEQVRERVLFAERQTFLDGTTRTGRRFLLGQFWADGDAEAATLGFVGGVDDLEVQLKQPLTDDADVVALYVGRTSSQPLGLLVVVPRPGTERVEYSPDAISPFAAAQDPAQSQGVVVFDRPDPAERAGTDRVRLTSPARGARDHDVAQLLCGQTSCS